MKINVVLGVAALVLFVGLIVAATHNSSLAEDIDGYKIDIEQLTFSRNDWKENAKWAENASIYWRELYENFEPKIIYDNNTEYVNTTEYIYETIYLGNRIYDVNRDGTIDYLDACEILWYVNHDPRWIQLKYREIYGNCWEKLYDVNIDGVVNIDDVAATWENCD